MQNTYSFLFLFSLLLLITLNAEMLRQNVDSYTRAHHSLLAHGR